MKLDKRLKKLVSPSILWGTIGLSVTTALVSIALWWHLSKLLSDALLKDTTLAQSLPDIGLVAALIALRFVVHRIQTWASAKIAFMGKGALRIKVLDEQLMNPPQDGQQQEGGKISTLWVRGIEATEAWFSQFLPQYYIAVLVPFMILVIAWIIDPLSALVFLISAPLVPIFMALIGSLAEKLNHSQWQRITRLGEFFLDTLHGLRTLRLLSIDRTWEQRLRTESRDLADSTLKVLRIAFLSSLVMEWIGSLSTAVLAVQLGLRLLGGGIPFQEALFLLMLAPEFYLPLRLLGTRYHAALEGTAAADQIFNPTTVATPQALTLVAPRHANEHFHLEHLTVQWPGRPEPILSNFQLSVNPGELVGITGPSGCGKSSLFAALLGLAPVQKGLLHTCSKDWNSWISELSWCPQSPTLFNRTLEENLTLGLTHKPPHQQILHALDQVGLSAWFQSLGLGLATPLGEGGALTSGGERRRIALARALLRNPKLILLDEPDAHLDPESVQWIQRTLQQSQHMTRLVISHHAPTLDLCHRVITL